MTRPRGDVAKDLMYTDDIQQLVTEAYGRLESPDGPGARLYAVDQMAALPPDAQDWLLGVGNPLAWADLKGGEVVADLGCGAGGDTLLAAQSVGPAGSAIGVDFLGEMIERGRAHARQAGLGNVAFYRSQMEDLPLADESVDVVVSNGSINLCARKSRVLAEAYRVLRPGGRLCVSDLTIRDEDLPTEILVHPSAWAG